MKPPFAILLPLVVCHLFASSHAAETEAQAVARFVDSIGVNVHPWLQYEKHHDALKAKLGELGVRHVREGLHPQAYAKAMAFFKEHGIKTTWIAGRRVGGEKEYLSPLNIDAIDDELRELKERALPTAAAIEGPNEYDLHSDKRDKDWPATLRRYQQVLFESVKADPALSALPVIGPSLTSENAYKKVGDLDAWIDGACVHHYQGAFHPGTPGWGPNGYGSIDWMKKFLVAHQSPGGKPIWNTECGQKPGGDPAKGELEEGQISESTEAKYLPRTFAEFFRRGYFGSFKYELLGKSHGLLRPDLSERPSFGALKNLIAILRDDRTAEPGSLDFSVEGAPKDLRQLLLRKSDGSFYLVLWREVSSFDPHKKLDLNPKPAAVTLKLAQPAGAQLFDVSASAEPQGTLASAASFPLEVADRLLIVRIAR